MQERFQFFNWFRLGELAIIICVTKAMRFTLSNVPYKSPSATSSQTVQFDLVNEVVAEGDFSSS